MCGRHLKMHTHKIGTKILQNQCITSSMRLKLKILIETNPHIKMIVYNILNQICSKGIVVLKEEG